MGKKKVSGRRAGEDGKKGRGEGNARSPLGCLSRTIGSSWLEERGREKRTLRAKRTPERGGPARSAVAQEVKEGTGEEKKVARVSCAPCFVAPPPSMLSCVQEECLEWRSRLLRLWKEREMRFGQKKGSEADALLIRKRAHLLFVPEHSSELPAQRGRSAGGENAAPEEVEG